MIYTQIRHRSRETWLQARSGTIGASASPAIMGENPWDTPLQLYGRLTGELPPKEQTMRMKVGHYLEPTIARLYEDETGRKTDDPGEFTIQRNKDFPWIHSTTDRFVQAFLDTGPGVLEEKAPGAHMADEWVEGIPLSAQIQVQHQLAVTGLEWGSVAALIGGQRFVWGDVERNQPFIDELLKQTHEFWERVQRRDPPEATGADVATLRLLHAEYEPMSIARLGEEAAEHDAMLVKALAAIKTAEGARDFHKAKIMELIGDNEIGELPGGGYYTWKTVNRKAYPVKATSYRELRRRK